MRSDRSALLEPLTVDLARLFARADRATAFARAGRHAAAERLLREVATSLDRRQAHRHAAAVWISLGRLLLERGRATAAGHAFSEALREARACGDSGAVVDATLWLAVAHTDAGRLTDAEALCRDALGTLGLTRSYERWGWAVLTRVQLWQGRIDEASMRPLPSARDDGDDLDPVVAASAEATEVRALLVVGRLFHAGLRAGALMTAVPEADTVARIVACTADLRVRLASGDLERAEQRLHEIALLARQARTPFRLARAQLLWRDALRRAGRDPEARRVLARVARTRRAAPELLKRAIDRRLRETPTAVTSTTGGPMSETIDATSAMTTHLLQLTHGEEGDDTVLTQLLTRALRQLEAARLDIVAHQPGQPGVRIGSGSGRPTVIGPRVVTAGAMITDESHAERETGVPIRLGPRLLGALVCRWPAGHHVRPAAVEILEVAAAVAAPTLETLLAGRREAIAASAVVPELVGRSADMADVRRAIARAARAPFAVLIEGESGVGKELAARAVHQLSPRRARRFCDVNCAALPDELLESELFGHVRGAFTGAVADKPGLFEEATGGTLFLDEVADLSPRGQAKLLRVIQEHEVRRVGETTSRPIDVRLVSAANRDMRAEAEANRFRLDLLYRLDVIRIRIPPLRERPEDIADLVHHFWKRAASRMEIRATLTRGVLAALSSYHWPGNVRELQNVLSALAVAAPARGPVRAALLPATINGAAGVVSSRLTDARAETERRCVERALAQAGGSRTQAAAALGLSRQGLLKTMARLGVGARAVGRTAS